MSDKKDITEQVKHEREHVDASINDESDLAKAVERYLEVAKTSKIAAHEVRREARRRSLSPHPARKP